MWACHADKGRAQLSGGYLYLSVAPNFSTTIVSPIAFAETHGRCRLRHLNAALKTSIECIDPREDLKEVNQSLGLAQCFPPGVWSCPKSGRVSTSHCIISSLLEGSE